MSSISLSPLRVKLAAPLLSTSSMGHSKLALPLSVRLETAHFWPFPLQMLMFIYPPATLFKEKSNSAKAVTGCLTGSVGATVRNAWCGVVAAPGEQAP